MTAHPIDSRVYGHLWTTPEIAAWFTDEGRTGLWLEVLAELAWAQAEVGLVPPAAAEAIAAHATVERLDLDEVAKQTRATGHSTLGLIRCLQAILPEPAREWVYFGATVQDLTDTAMAVMFKRVGDVLDRDLRRVRAATVALAGAHRDTVMCGRTHGQPGLPVTFGFKAAVWADELGRHLDRLVQGRARWEVVQLGGAVGTLEFFGETALELRDAFADRLALAVPDIPWLTARDRVAEFATVLAQVTSTLAKIGGELYQLQRPEIGEVAEPFTPGQVGSITMPHKRNPERAEHLDTLARLVRADAGVALEGLVHEHERDGRAWKTEWAVLPSACSMTAAALHIGAELLEGLHVDPRRMAANVAAQRGYVMSEPVLRALADRFGKHHAQDVVYRAAMAGLDKDLSLRDALRADDAVAAELSAEEVDGLLEPQRALGAAQAFVDRVVDRANR